MTPLRKVTGRTIFSPRKFLGEMRVSMWARMAVYRSALYFRIEVDYFSPNLDLVVIGLLVLLHVDIDGEMRIHVTHLVLVALGDANDQIVDDGLDSAEGSDILARAVVDLDLDDRFLGQREAHRDVREIFC